MKKYILQYSCFLLFISFIACEPPIPTVVNIPTLYSEDQQEVYEDRGEGIGNVTLDGSKVYILDGFVFVNSGQTLTIPAGTIIKAKGGSKEDASALIIARGGKIMAQGSANKPIVFTSISDGIQPGEVATKNITSSSKGLWGGLIVLGKASLNSSSNESAVEGIPTNEKRGLYGGSDDNDNSGVLEYVSIRFGGSEIGAGNEVNGLTLGGVGKATKIEHIEIFGNNDDGIEFFGGTVNTKYIVVGYCKDDSFDSDEGWRGKNQFWFIYQKNNGDRGGEHDGGTDPETGTPYSIPMIANATFHGQGTDTGKRALTFRDNSGGKYYNSIFTLYTKGIDIEDLGNGEDSYMRLEKGDIEVKNNIFWNVANNEIGKIVLQTKINGNGEEIESIDASANVNIEENEILDPKLDTYGVAQENKITENLAVIEDDFFTKVNYKGAFEPGKEVWFKGWTQLYVVLSSN